MIENSNRDYPEDFDKENGLYLCKCSCCGREFTGHKRRVLCKLCSINKNLIMLDKANNVFQPTNVIKWKRVYRKHGNNYKEERILMQQYINSDYKVKWEKVDIEDDGYFD